MPQGCAPIHETRAVRDFLERHPHVRLHDTPTYSSWLNQIELWFSKLERHSCRMAFLFCT